MSVVPSVCCYCGTGCGVLVESDGARITGVAGDPSHPSSRGRLCTKGSTLHLTMTDKAQAGRLRFPAVHGKRATWDAALDYLAERFAQTIARHGPDSVAFYVSGQLLTEDYYVFNKLAKGLIGTANIDTNSRLCMSSAVTGYTQTLGVDAPPSCYEDIDHAGCFFIAGSNTAFAHPVLFARIEEARERRPETKLIVVDPRRTQTAERADLHLAILPGTDVALFHAMLHVMLWEQLVDEGYVAAHTEGMGELRALVRDCTPSWASEVCGVRADDIVTAARWFARSGSTLSLYCQGLNQSSSGTAKNAALVNLHLATGQIGRAGTGPFSLTGQPNAMGGREVGGLATTLAAHRDLRDPAHRAEMERRWGVARVPDKPGLTAVELFEAVGRGDVKIVWIACTNPAQSLPDLPSVRAALGKAELVVLQEAYATTETAAFAHVLLPATSWGEKDGTMTNSERRIARVRSSLPKPFEARHDWEIVCDFAKRLEKWCQTPFPAASPGVPVHLEMVSDTIFPFTTPEEIWNEHRECTRGRDLDITGLSYAILDAQGPQQWPYPEGAAAGATRLYADGRFPTASGKARFFVEGYRPVAERVDARYPMRLTTGRLRDQWHGLSRTGAVATLYGHVPEPRLGMCPADMARRALKAGELVRVESRRGALHVVVEADASLRSGQAYLPMHWGRRHLGGTASEGVNTVTSAALDPLSRQPELKHAAVKITAAQLPWRLMAIAEADPSLVDRLQALQGDVAFASTVLLGGAHEGVIFRAAHGAAPCPEWIDRLDAAFGLDGADVVRYDDARRARSRRIRIAGERLVALRIAGEPACVAAAEWMRASVADGTSVAAIRRLLLSPDLNALAATMRPQSPIVCRCHGVREDRIEEVLARTGGDARERLAALQAELACGTECGSCLPELRTRIGKAGPKAGRMAA